MKQPFNLCYFTVAIDSAEINASVVKGGKLLSYKNTSVFKYMQKLFPWVM